MTCIILSLGYVVIDRRSENCNIFSFTSPFFLLVPFKSIFSTVHSCTDGPTFNSSVFLSTNSYLAWDMVRLGWERVCNLTSNSNIMRTVSTCKTIPGQCDSSDFPFLQAEQFVGPVTARSYMQGCWSGMQHWPETGWCNSWSLQGQISCSQTIIHTCYN